MLPIGSAVFLPVLACFNLMLKFVAGVSKRFFTILLKGESALGRNVKCERSQLSALSSRITNSFLTSNTQLLKYTEKMLNLPSVDGGGRVLLKRMMCGKLIMRGRRIQM